MNGKLKAKAKIFCCTCGCALKRTKSIQVTATDKVSAIAEAKEKIQAWQKSLDGQNCKVCQSIIDMA